MLLIFSQNSTARLPNFPEKGLFRESPFLPINRPAAVGTGGDDGHGDGDITAGDYDVWRTDFGNALPGTGSGGQGAGIQIAVRRAASDEALATLRQAQPDLIAAGMEGAISKEQRASVRAALRIADLGSGIGPRRAPSVKSPEPEGTRLVATGETLYRDDALVAWLASRADYRLVDHNNIAAQMDGKTHRAATDDAIDEMFDVQVEVTV